MLDDIEHNTGIIIDGYLVRNIEEIGLIGSRKSKVKDIITDTGLYVFNKYAGYELKDIADKAGVRLLSHTLPLELNNSELQDTLLEVRLLCMEKYLLWYLNRVLERLMEYVIRSVVQLF
mgnify:CR=1 FL=1